MLGCKLRKLLGESEKCLSRKLKLGFPSENSEMTSQQSCLETSSGKGQALGEEVMTVHIKHQVTFHTIKIRSNIKHQITSRQSNTRAFVHQILSASPCSSVSSSAPRFSFTAADNVDFAQIILKVDTCRPNCKGL